MTIHFGSGPYPDPMANLEAFAGVIQMLMQDSGNSLSDVKKRKRGKAILLLLGVFLLFSVLLLRVWFLSRAVELAYEIDRLAADKEALEEENERASLEIARLKSPERIGRIAEEDLKMVRSLDAKVIILER